MQVKLSESEVSDILIQWAEKNISHPLNNVEFEGYGYMRSATLSYVEPVEQKAEETK